MDRKQLRRAMGVTGWIAIVYNLLMTVCVFSTVLVEMILNMMGAVSQGVVDYEQIMASAMTAATSAWGYFVTAIAGIIILLCWKKPRYWKEEIWARGKEMRPGAFFGILAIFLSVQVLYQIYATILELLYNCFGFSLMAGMESVSGGADGLSMFLYMAVLAPVTEEILFRGLIQRTLMPYGKKIAILGSAFLFGLMHGNLLQTPFAFLVGLVLGWVATEYSIAWAMLLHMINNLVLGDMVTRLTQPLGEMGMTAVIWAILLVSLVAAIVTLIRRRGEIRRWNQRNILGRTYAGCFFGSGGVITFTVYSFISIIVTMFILATPL